MQFNSDQAALFQLQKQQKLAHYMLLATVIATVANIALLLGNSSFQIPYSASLAYYLTFLGFFFDGYTLGTYTATGMVMSFAVLAIWLVVWWLARKHRRLLLAGLILVAADTAFLVIFSLLFLANPSSCLLDGIFHLAVIYEISVGLRAYKRVEQIQNQPIQEDSDPWDTESQYSDNLQQ